MEYIFMRSLLSLFIFLLFSVAGLYDLWDTYKPRRFGQSCDFCKIFWVSVAVHFIFPGTRAGINLFASMFAAAALTLILLSLTRWK